MNELHSLLDAYGGVMLYPEHDHGSRLEACLNQLPPKHDAVRKHLDAYWVLVKSWSLSKREEQYIKTFDLNKTGTLDLGWHLFGEDYNRGLFLVKLRQHLQFLEIAESNELPDHVSQILRILGRLPRDEANTFAYACVIPSLATIADGIQPENPHRHLVDGLLELLRSLFEVPLGFEESTESEFDPRYLPLPVIQ